MLYRLYTYDVWGNSRDGWNVNDVYPQATVIEIDEKTSDRAINRRLQAHGIEWWDGEFGHVLYARNKKNHKPVCELRPMETI